MTLRPRAAGFLATYDGAIRDGFVARTRADKLKEVVRDRVDALQREQQAVGGTAGAGAEPHMRHVPEACAWRRTQDEQEVRSRGLCCALTAKPGGEGRRVELQSP